MNSYIDSLPPSQRRTVRAALRILEGLLAREPVTVGVSEVAPDYTVTSPNKVVTLLQLQLAGEEREHFVGLFLDNRHHLIAVETLFAGTIDGSAVHPREVVKRALAHNAAAMIVAHNHPSGYSEPSVSDKAITRRLHEALALVDVRLLDHFIVGSEVVSFSERGLL